MKQEKIIIDCLKVLQGFFILSSLLTYSIKMPLDKSINNR